MTDLYEPLSPQARKEAANRFLEFLLERDGTPEPEARRLSKREEYFKRIDSRAVRSNRQVDKLQFQRNHEGRRLESHLDPVMLWLLCTAKLNRGERYGVDTAFKSRKGHLNPEDPMTFIGVEEFYHTRMLLDVLKVFDLSLEILPPNSRVTRWLIQAMAYLPKRFSMPLTMAGEVFGVAAFYLLREKAKELFAGEPVVLERILSLYNEIMVDEIGHVFFARANLGRTGLWLAKKLQGSVMKSILSDLPELLQLFSREKFEATLAQVEQILNGKDDWPVKPFRYFPGNGAMLGV
ncbi:MAG TPA: hypothetical protein VH186_10785 [Chloroflexia bacterium]|nr:hypothetical protein [Chloroflexia bacterium]